jgi:hypothetical protein
MNIFTIEVVKNYDPMLVKELWLLEKQAFPPRMQYTEGESYYIECLKDKANINVVMRDNEGKVIGYVVAIPQSNVYEILKQYDPDMKDDPERLYVDTIQILPGKRQAFGIMKLINALIEEASKRGLNKFSMHVRKSNGLSRIILRLFPSTVCLRTIDNWYNFGEPFDYIEGTYTGKRR